MDFTFLPKTTYKGKSFVRYSIRAKEVPASSLVIHNGFYYIGKNPANIEKLVKLFKRGKEAIVYIVVIRIAIIFLMEIIRLLRQQGFLLAVIA